MLNLAVEAARRAGALIRSEWGRGGFAQKARADLVTATDQRSEALLRELLPGAFLGEEGGGELGHESWVVDPLDGTTNFVHGYPRVAVSIARVRGREPLFGVVYDVMRDELFSSEERLCVSGRELPEALLATGPYQLPMWRHLEKQCLGVRLDGCASLDFCYVACGRLDGFYELDLKPWDVAAGAAILRSAGGRLSDWEGRPADPWSGDFVASNGVLHEVLLARLSEARSHA